MLYAITSTQWQEIQKEKERVKLRNQEVIDNKKEEESERHFKKKLYSKKNEKEEHKKRWSRRTWKHEKAQTQVLTSKASKTIYTVGSFIIVEYKDEYFPGEIIKKKNEYYVRVMCMSGLNWKWPEKEDLFWYKKEYVMQHIMPPKLANSRNVYDVPDIKNYR